MKKLHALRKSKSFLIRTKQQEVVDSDRYLYLDELRKASPIKSRSDQSERAIIIHGLGKSEKFLDKPRVLEALKSLHYISGDNNFRRSSKNSKNFNSPASDSIPMIMSHQVYRKIHTPYSPGVVRIKSHDNLPRPTPTNTIRMRNISILNKSPSRNCIIRRSTPSGPMRPLASDSSSSPLKHSQNATSVSNTQIKVRSKTNLLKSNTEKEDYYLGQTKEGTKEGHGSYYHALHEVIYKGAFSGDRAHGNGSLKFASGHKITGIFVNGRLYDGVARIRYKDGGVYHGEIKNGAREGSGTMTYANGGVYKGCWDKDQRKGLGVIIYQGSFFFEGIFSNDYTDGPGILLKKFVFCPDSNTDRGDPPTIYYDIQGCLDKSDAFGSLITPFRTFASLPVDPMDLVYLTLSSSSNPIQNLPKLLASGAFTSGRLNGAGMARYGSFGTYVGNFKEGYRQGFGKMHYTDLGHNCEWFPETDGVYTGEWREDKRHGIGTMVWGNGTRYTGMFYQDRRHNVTGVLAFSNGDVYEGGFVNDIMEGKCVILKAKGGIKISGVMMAGVLANDKAGIEFGDGRVYEGEIAREAPHGVGILRFPNGNVYEGNMNCGEIEGFGRMVYSNGEVYEGYWEHNARNGKGWIYPNDNKEKWEGEWANDKMIVRLNKL